MKLSTLLETSGLTFTLACPRTDTQLRVVLGPGERTLPLVATIGGRRVDAKLEVAPFATDADEDLAVMVNLDGVGVPAAPVPGSGDDFVASMHDLESPEAFAERRRQRAARYQDPMAQPSRALVEGVTPPRIEGPTSPSQPRDASAPQVYDDGGPNEIASPSTTAEETPEAFNRRRERRARAGR